MIKLDSAEIGSVEVETLKYSETFRYSSNFYTRVGSHDVKKKLEVLVCKMFNTGTGSLNTKDEVLVLNLLNGRLSYFKRSTLVKKVNLFCRVEDE